MCLPIGQTPSTPLIPKLVKVPQENSEVSTTSKPETHVTESPKVEPPGQKKVSAVNPPEEEAARQAVAAMLDPQHVGSLRGTFASLDEALDFAAKDKGKEVIQAFVLDGGQTVYAVQDLKENQQAEELLVDESERAQLVNDDGTIEEITEISISETVSSNDALSLLGDTSLPVPTEESTLSPQEHKHFSAWKEALQREDISPQEAKELSTLLAKLSPQEFEKLNSRTAATLSPKLQKLLEKIEKSGSWTAYNSLQAISKLAQLKSPGLPVNLCDKFLGRLAGIRRAGSIQYGKDNQTAAKTIFAQAARIRASANGDPTKLAKAEQLEAKAQKLNEGSLKRLESEKKDAYRFVKQYEDKGKVAPDYLTRDTAKAAQGVAAAQITQAQTKQQSLSEYPEELVLARENLEFARKVDPDLQLSPQQSVSDEVREHNLEQAQLSRELETLDYTRLKTQIMGDPQKQKGESLYPLREKRHSLDSAYSQEIAWNENGPANSGRNSRLLELLAQQDGIRAEMAADYAYHKELENAVSGNVRNLNEGIGKIETAQRNFNESITELDTSIKKIDSELAEIQLQRQKVLDTQSPLVGDVFLSQLDEKAATLISAKMNKNVEKAVLQTRVSELQDQHQTLKTRLKESTQLKDQSAASLQQWQRSGLTVLDHNKMTPGILTDDLAQMAGGLTDDRLTAVRDTAHAKREALARDILADQGASPESQVNAIESMLDTSRYYGESATKERYRENLNYNEHELLNSSERAHKAEALLTDSIDATRTRAIPEEAREQLLIESIETARTVSKGMVYSDPVSALKILDQARLLIPETTQNAEKADQLRTEIFESATEQQAILMDPKNLRLLANWSPDTELIFDTNALDAREDFRNQLLSETANDSPGYQEMQTTLALEAEARALFAYEIGQMANRVDKGTAQAIDKSGEFFKQYEDRYDEARPDIFFWQDDAADAAGQLTDVNGEIVNAYDAANGLRHLQAAMGKELSPKDFYALRVQLQWNEIQSSGNAENFMWTLMDESQRDTLMGASTRWDDQGNQITRDVPASERKALVDKWTKNTGEPLQKMLEATPKPKPEVDGDPRLASLNIKDKFFAFTDNPATATQKTLKGLEALTGTPTGLSSLVRAGYEEMALQGGNPDEPLTTKGLAKELNEEDYEWKSFESETLPAVIANNILDNVWSSLIPAGWILKGAKAGLAAAKWIAGGVKGAEAARKVSAYGDKALHAIKTLSKYIDPELANKVINKLKIESTLGKAGVNIAFGVGGEFAQMGLEEVSPEVAKIYGKYKTVLSFGGTKIFEQDSSVKMLIGLAAIGTEASAHTIIDELVDDPELRALLKGFVSGVKASVDDKVMPTESHKDSQPDSDSGQAKSPKAVTPDAIEPSKPKRDTESPPTGESTQPAAPASVPNGGNIPPNSPPIDPPPSSGGGSDDFGGPRKTPRHSDSVAKKWDGPDPEFKQMPIEKTREIREKIQKGDPLDDSDTRDLLDDVATDSRMNLLGLANDVNKLDHNFKPDAVNGKCGEAQAAVYYRLRAMGIPEENIQIHQARELIDPAQLPDGAAVNHAFIVVKMPNNKTYVIDPTFRQFFTDSGPGQFGNQALKKAGGIEMADQLLTKGYAELPDKAAQELYLSFIPVNQNKSGVAAPLEPKADMGKGSTTELDAEHTGQKLKEFAEVEAKTIDNEKVNTKSTVTDSGVSDKETSDVSPSTPKSNENSPTHPTSGDDGIPPIKPPTPPSGGGGNSPIPNPSTSKTERIRPERPEREINPDDVVIINSINTKNIKEYGHDNYVLDENEIYAVAQTLNNGQYYNADHPANRFGEAEIKTKTYGVGKNAGIRCPEALLKKRNNQYTAVEVKNRVVLGQHEFEDETFPKFQPLQDNNFPVDRYELYIGKETKLDGYTISKDGTLAKVEPAEIYDPKLKKDVKNPKAGQEKQILIENKSLPGEGIPIYVYRANFPTKPD